MVRAFITSTSPPASTMANTFNWSLGHEGKGNVYNDGAISTWNLDEVDGPHHDEKAAEDGYDYPAWRFYIAPNGGLHDGGIGHRGFTPYTDDQHAAEVVAQHPAIWDARDEISHAYDDPANWTGGFGHAERLMLSKLASSGWADFHTEFKIPRATRKQIRRWVDRLRWPQNHKKHDAREYHITVLDMDEYDEDFAKWAKKEVQGKELTFKSTGIDMFNDFVVVRLECPEWEDLASKWTEEADRRGLEPHKFPGGPKAHVSVGRSHDKKWPRGIPDPHIKFRTRMFNIKRNDGWHESSMVDFENDQYPSCRSLESEPKSPDEEIQGLSGDSLVRYDDSWYITDGVDGDFISGPWSDEDEAQSINHDEWRESSWHIAVESEPADELAQWLQSFETTPTTAPSPYHTDVDQFAPQIVEPVAQYPHIDPPKKPYKPYNWAEEGWEESPMDRASNVQWASGDGVCDNCGAPQIGLDVDDQIGHSHDRVVCRECGSYVPVDGAPKRIEANTHHCPQCDAMIDGQICGNCGYDPFTADSDYDKVKNEWYDRAWSRPQDQPREVPHQPLQWGPKDNAADISLISKWCETRSDTILGAMFDGEPVHSVGEDGGWIVGTGDHTWRQTDDLPSVWSGESCWSGSDMGEDRSSLR